MPGIFGLVDNTAPATLGMRLRAMGSRMRHHGTYLEELHEEPPAVAIGRLRLEFQLPNLHRGRPGEESMLAVVDGEIYDADEQRQSLRASGHVIRGESPAELLAAGYSANGKAFLKGLHGKFAAVIWDRHQQRLTLVNDRFGMRPIYYAQLPGGLLFASEIKALLTEPQVSRQTNLRGIAQFFTFGQFLSEDTLLESVRLLPAASVLTFDLRGNHLQLEPYWQMAFEPSQNGTKGSNALLDRVENAFGEAVRRTSGGVDHLGLSLSGGLDSRTILGAIDDDQELTTVSVGTPGSADHQSASEMARLMNRPHHQCHLGSGFLERFEMHLRHMVRLTDGHYLSQCIVMPTLPVYRDLGIQVLLRGHAGELMHMRKAYNFSLDDRALALSDEASLENWLFEHLQSYLLEGIGNELFAPAHRRDIAELARDSLRDCLGETAAMRPFSHRIWQMFLSQRVRRETALSMVKFGSLVETRLPYLDNELIDSLFAMPPEMKLDAAIQTHILRRRRPAFLKVVNVNTGARMDAGPVGRIFGKVRQKVLGKLGVRGYQPYERLGLWLRRELRPLVQKMLLNDQCLGRGVFDPGAVKKIVEDHSQGKNHTYLIMALLTFELGQRDFLESQASPAFSPAVPSSAHCAPAAASPN
jgi:asparagine synthase (glutamine-hydrolysing)